MTEEKDIEFSNQTSPQKMDEPINNKLNLDDVHTNSNGGVISIPASPQEDPVDASIPPPLCDQEEQANDSPAPMFVDTNQSLGTEPIDEEPEEERLTRFPMGRIKRIMKLDPDVRVVTPEATFLVNKSLELFVQSLVWEAHRYTEQSRKKTMAKSDVERAIDGVDALAFLEGALDD